MAKYIVTSGCEEEVNGILDYIAADNVDAARGFFDRLAILFGRLAENPKMGRERPELSEGLRSFPFGRYIIFYRIWAGEVAIVRFLHGARDLEEIFKDEE